MRRVIVSNFLKINLTTNLINCKTIICSKVKTLIKTLFYYMYNLYLKHVSYLKIIWKLFKNLLVFSFIYLSCVRFIFIKIHISKYIDAVIPSN